MNLTSEDPPVTLMLYPMVVAAMCGVPSITPWSHLPSLLEYTLTGSLAMSGTRKLSAGTMYRSCPAEPTVRLKQSLPVPSTPAVLITFAVTHFLWVMDQYSTRSPSANGWNSGLAGATSSCTISSTKGFSARIFSNSSEISIETLLAVSLARIFKVSVLLPSFIAGISSAGRSFLETMLFPASHVFPLALAMSTSQTTCILFDASFCPVVLFMIISPPSVSRMAKFTLTVSPFSSDFSSMFPDLILFSIHRHQMPTKNPMIISGPRTMPALITNCVSQPMSGLPGPPRAQVHCQGQSV
mmetsp:Transcript_105503/g.187636  ORF Transcript_105503/g.187636 Transcript_105503/m.187636 type:complete len:298 (-) Transcript_105503:2756-3649(-)